MRQLDLFGSPIENPKPVGKPVETEVSQKDKRTVVSEDTIESSPTVEPVYVEEEKSTQEITSYPADWDIPATEVAIVENTEVGDNIPEEEISLINDINEPADDNNGIDTTIIINEDSLLNDDKKISSSSVTASEDESNKVVEVIAETIKPFSELSKTDKTTNNNSVIFDDGKISVKLKKQEGKESLILEPKKEPITKVAQKRGRKSFKEIDAEVDLIDVPEDEILFQKQYYPISEVAKWFRVNASLLRFWENEFDILKPRKNRRGDRLFRPEDVKNLQLIHQLLRQRKYSIEGAKEYLKTNKKKADVEMQLTQTLQKFKGFLLDLKANLQS